MCCSFVETAAVKKIALHFLQKRPQKRRSRLRNAKGRISPRVEVEVEVGIADPQNDDQLLVDRPPKNAFVFSMMENRAQKLILWLASKTYAHNLFFERALAS